MKNPKKELQYLEEKIQSGPEKFLIYRVPQVLL